MRIDYRGKDLNAEMPRCIVTDVDTGERITPVVFADDDTGEFEQLVRVDGVFQIDAITKRPKTVRGRANIKIKLLDMW